MGEAKKRAEREPLVSVIIPSRRRPDKLERCVRSLWSNRGDSKIEIIIGLDDDDETRAEYEKRLADLGAPVSIIVGPRPLTMGGLINELAKHVTGRWLMAFVDDCTIETPDWPARIAEEGMRLPRRVGVLHLRDDFHAGFASYPIMSREMVAAVGYVHVPYFAFWFNDTWWDEIGILLNLKREVPVQVTMPDGRGKTNGLTDLAFWAEFFTETRPERVRDALKLLKLAYDDGDPAVGTFMANLASRQNFCAQKISTLRNPRVAAHFEATMAGSPPAPHYPDVKAAAEAKMKDLAKNTPRRLKIALCIPSGRTWEAATAIDAIAIGIYSSMCGIDIMPANMQSSMITLGRNQTVDVCLEAGADYLMWIDSDMKFPPDTLMRLLGHQKDIVGATYNKRVPPYETLGKLKGTRPEQLRGGVHEALLLPAGCMLVKAEVYRTLGWPWYFETYNWAGSDGFAQWKAMMRDYWRGLPDEDLLDSVKDTAFAEWITKNYKMGEFDESILYFSEDNNFCRKARKAGYQLWCDLDLTQEMVHLGTLEVRCKLPEEAEIKAEIAAQEAAGTREPAAQAVEAAD